MIHPPSAASGNTLPPEGAQLIDAAARVREAVLAEVRKAVVGQDETLDLLLCGIVAGGHVLLEGVPGVAKTLMVRAVARAIAARFKRIQFTPDLMPADILGTSVFDLRQNVFSLAKGPIFTDLLLADEINRAPAKTQAALLEAMQERTVSLEGAHHRLPHPEPGRVRGDLSAARGPARPLPAQDRGRLPRAR